MPTETDGQENQPPPTFQNRGDPVIEEVSSDKRMISGTQGAQEEASSQKRMIITQEDVSSSKRMIRTDGFSDVVKTSNEDSSLVRISDQQRVQPKYYSRFMQKMYGGENNQEQA